MHRSLVLTLDKDFISSLPSELIELILSYLNHASIYSLYYTSKTLNDKLFQIIPTKIITKLYSFTDLFINTIEYDQLELLKWLESTWPSRYLLKGPDDEVIPYIYNNTLNRFTYVGYSIYFNTYEIFLYLVNQCTDYNINAYGNIAVEYGNINVLRWSVSSGYEISSFTLHIAVIGGSIDVLDFLHQRPELRLVKFSSLYSTAVANGHLNVLKWLKERKYAIKISREYLDLNAASKNRLDILKWLYYNDKHDVFYESVSELVSYLGHVKILEWLVKKGVDLTKALMDKAIEGKQDHVIQWLKERGCPS